MKIRNGYLVVSIMVVLLPACRAIPASETGATPLAEVTLTPTEPSPAATLAPPDPTVTPLTETPPPPTITPLAPALTASPTNIRSFTTETPPPVTHTAPPPGVTPTAVPPVVTAGTAPDSAGISPLPPGPTPTEAEVRFARGLEYYRNEQWEAAIAEFQQVTKLDAELSLAFGMLGYSYANGPGDFETAIAALETYLRLSPEAEDRAQVETDLATMRSILAGQKPLPDLQVPPGQALFVFVNYTVRDWNVDVGPYFMQVPARPAGEEYAVETLALDPGSYTWQAHSPGGAYTITDNEGRRAFEISVVEGEIVTYEAR